MKKQLMTLVLTSLVFLIALIPNEAVAQFCCCPACPDCIPQGANASCGAACFFDSSCGTPDFAESTTDAACLGTACNPLPVEFTSFDVREVGKTMLLSWHTASEINNEGFEVLRASGLSMEFEFVGFVGGHGTTAVPQNYTFVDYNPLPGTNYYRLQQIDFDGQSSLSPIAVANRNSNDEILLWPSLAKSNILLSTQSNSNVTNYQVRVFDMMGRKVMETEFRGSVNMDISSLEEGNYVVNVAFNNSSQTLRFVKVAK
ncbi:MAG: T9SS type A sorting domain-containing protein [Bacteroidota bacterium]